jgi:hypothetical protein
MGRVAKKGEKWMKRNYEELLLEILLVTEDVITASGDDFIGDIFE